MILLRELKLLPTKAALDNLPEGKLLINTINSHSYNVSRTDKEFERALLASDVLLPDGISIVFSTLLLQGKRIERVAGYDLFMSEMRRLNKIGGKCFFLGSSPQILAQIKARAYRDFPNVEVHSYSPPYRKTFSNEESAQMVAAVAAVEPDVLFVGMTAPKQEKWVYSFYDSLKATRICSIGAVFDFYSGSIKRAPEWMQDSGLEWLHRLMQSPRRLWRRYVVGNPRFILHVLSELLRG
jgi:N-acetylglucosaminyldiphosphoundecaprenol N-acetyl-beta-D-mannosaminyltransferase